MSNRQQRSDGDISYTQDNDENNKSRKPFVERAGDWVCIKCKNLNFSFRVICNRCQLPKTESEEIYDQYMTNLMNYIKMNEMMQSQMLQNQFFSQQVNNYNINNNIYESGGEEGVNLNNVNMTDPNSYFMNNLNNNTIKNNNIINNNEGLESIKGKRGNNNNNYYGNLFNDQDNNVQKYNQFAQFDNQNLNKYG
jgi:hypothetical protein